MAKKLIRALLANLSDGNHRINFIADRLTVERVWRLMNWIEEGVWNEAQPR
jgi:hypothetical protein